MRTKMRKKHPSLTLKYLLVLTEMVRVGMTIRNQPTTVMNPKNQVVMILNKSIIMTRRITEVLPHPPLLLRRKGAVLSARSGLLKMTMMRISSVMTKKTLKL